MQGSAAFNPHKSHIYYEFIRFSFPEAVIQNENDWSPMLLMLTLWLHSIIDTYMVWESPKVMDFFVKLYHLSQTFFFFQRDERWCGSLGSFWDGKGRWRICTHLKKICSLLYSLSMTGEMYLCHSMCLLYIDTVCIHGKTQKLSHMFTPKGKTMHFLPYQTVEVSYFIKLSHSGSSKSRWQNESSHIHVFSYHNVTLASSK